MLLDDWNEEEVTQRQTIKIMNSCGDFLCVVCTTVTKTGGEFDAKYPLLQVECMLGSQFWLVVC